MAQRTVTGTVITRRGKVRVIRCPNSHGSNLLDKEQPSIIVSGEGLFEFLGRWTTLSGVPTPEGGRTTLNALDASDEQIVWAITHDESIYA